jgi:hypothetical protein
MQVICHYANDTRLIIEVNVPRSALHSFRVSFHEKSRKFCLAFASSRQGRHELLKFPRSDSKSAYTESVHCY